MLKLLYVLIICNVLLPSRTQAESNSIQTPPLAPLSEEITPKYGNDSREALYLQVWETHCLTQFVGDLKSDESGPAWEVHHDEDPSKDPFIETEKLVIYNLDWFTKTDVTPFVKNIVENKKMGYLDMTFKGFFVFMFILASLLVIGILTFCVFSLTKFRFKTIKYRPRTYKCCNGFTIIISIILLVLMIINFVWFGKMLSIQKDLLCEATRVPHSLFFGNPEIHLDVPRSSHFLGFETFRGFTNNFLREIDSIKSGQDFDILQDLDTINFSKIVDDLALLMIEFNNKFSEKKVTNSLGKKQQPYSINHSLKIYHSAINNMLDNYKVVSDRVKNITLLNPTLQDPTKLEIFKKDLTSSASSLSNLQIHLSEFWNKVLNTSFDSAIFFKTALVALVLLTFAVVVLQFLIQGILNKICKCNRFGRKTPPRLLVIGAYFFILLSCVALFEISRGIYTSVYGCSLMYQLRTDPFNTNDKIKSYLMTDKQIYKVYEHCYLSTSDSEELGFLHLAEGDKEQQSMQEMVEFLDSIKLIHDDYKVIDNSTNKYYTVSFISVLESYKNGEAFDFDDVFSSLNSLNQFFHCSNISFALTKNACSQKVAKKDICIGILEEDFETADCVTAADESKELFEKLKTHIQEEVLLLDEMLLYLQGPRDGQSMLELIDKIVTQFTLIDEKVRQLDTNLHTNMDDLAQGSIKDWLECGVIRDEVAKTFNNLCNKKLEDLLKFSDLNFCILTLSMFSMLIVFLLTFCLKDIEEDPGKFLPSESRQWQNMSDVFDDPSSGSKRDNKTLNIGDVEIKAFSKEGIKKVEM